MFFKKNIFLIFLFLYLSAFSQTQTPFPKYTEIISQKKTSEANVERIVSHCCSSLSKEEILQFYKEIFFSQKMKGGESFGSDIIMFERFPFLSKSIRFIDENSNRRCYILEENYYKNIKVLPTAGFTSPQKLDFMPTLSNAMQFVYSTYFYPMTAVWYLSFATPDEICDFYIKNMPSFGWKLKDVVVNKGIFNFYDFFLMVDPFSKALPMFKDYGYQDFIPPLSLYGKTLTFIKEDKSRITITVYKFDDILQKAENSVWDVSDFKNYGTTIIGIFYFSKKVN